MKPKNAIDVSALVADSWEKFEEAFLESMFNGFMAEQRKAVQAAIQAAADERKRAREKSAPVVPPQPVVLTFEEAMNLILKGDENE